MFSDNGRYLVRPLTPSPPTVARKLLDELQPAGIFGAELVGEGAPENILETEREALGRVSDKRLWDFTRGRWCARTALVKAGLGNEATPVMIGPSRMPLWPPFVVGSIAHCDDMAVAVVGHTSRFVSVGVDVEPNLPLPDGVAKQISSQFESDRLPFKGPVCWDRLLFCSKEAIYKVWFPIERRWLGFDDVTVVIDPARQTFTATLPDEGIIINEQRVTELCGHFAASSSHLFTIVAIPPLPLPR